MKTDSIPFYRRLTFKFLASTALFILLIETILLIVSIHGMEERLVQIRQMVLNKIPPVSENIQSMILSENQINQILDNYRQNILIMVSVIITVVLSGLYFVVRHWFLEPIRTMLEYNQISQNEGPQNIPEDDIPDDEIGLLMRSRNEMLETINTLYNEDALETLCQTVDAKDEYTEGHSRRVGMIGELLGRKMNLEEETCRKLNYSGTLHDIGKIGVPDDILNKPSSLTDDEFAEVKKHPERGVQIIQFSNISEDVIEGIKYHHEEYDGSGYPEGLEGENIPFFGRVLGVADAIDAMLSDRSYRTALDFDVVVDELRSNSGSQFDPDIAELGIELLREARRKNMNFRKEFLSQELSRIHSIPA